MIADGSFREDLFYRLNVIALQVPPLRRRMEDLSQYIAFFVSKYCRKNNRETLSISPEALKAMEHYSWPGNIRELENVIERAVILTPGNTITLQILPADLYEGGEQDTQVSFRRGMKLEEIELRIIQDVLLLNHGDRAKSAEELGIGVRTLYRKLTEINALEPAAVEPD
jgi:DNA-binding NtrC family response regulator